MQSQKLADLAERHNLADFSLEAQSKQKSFDEINKAEHYNSGSAKCSNCGHPIECIDVIEDLPFCVASIFKYLWRRNHKGTLLKDLKKCEYYIKREIARITKQENEE